MSVKIKGNLSIMSCLVMLLLFLVTSCGDFLDFYDEISEPTSESLYTSREELNLKGNVKSYKLIVYKAVENIKEDIVFVSESIFNKDRNKIELIRYNKDGESIGYKDQYDYDDSKNHIKTSTYDSIGNLVSNVVFKYSKNNLIKEVYSNGFVTYEYDENSNKTEYYRQNSEGLWWKDNYKYDEIGNLVEETWSDYWTPSSEGKIIYQYDDKEKLIEKTVYSSGGDLSNKAVYFYNEKGQLIEDRDEYSRYGSNARSKIIFKYDEKGTQIERYRYSLEGRVQYRNAYQYEYDLKDNWIRKVEIVNGVIEFIAEREILYFD